jgi:membrane protease YdiL (CAAX protease family)
MSGEPVDDSGRGPGAFRRLPWVELLFSLFLVFAGAAFTSRAVAHARWLRGQSTDPLGAAAWAWSLAAFGPFLALVALAPNPELSERVPRRDRRRQILMFLSIVIMFCLEVYLVSE